MSWALWLSEWAELDKVGRGVPLSNEYAMVNGVWLIRPVNRFLVKAYFLGKKMPFTVASERQWPLLAIVL
ncbi:hypothetical protein [Lampropedia aestuarii]|uniref:hypothetical protein n=1 Tax=Lampropedia aestuarii TaxID=2562762 RepID=UPI0024695E5A|nr:hypothetical protein [Lampropedia aestuarii]MDH5858491.1 hypothetical protein [Lampropedia aestuarii]